VQQQGWAVGGGRRSAAGQFTASRVVTAAPEPGSTAVRKILFFYTVRKILFFERSRKILLDALCMQPIVCVRVDSEVELC